MKSHSLAEGDLLLLYRSQQGGYVSKFIFCYNTQRGYVNLDFFRLRGGISFQFRMKFVSLVTVVEREMPPHWLSLRDPDF